MNEIKRLNREIVIGVAIVVVLFVGWAILMAALIGSAMDSYNECRKAGTQADICLTEGR
jgi:hypothetical protein